MVMTIGSSCRVSITRKSWSVKVISGMLRGARRLTAYTLLILRRCLFLAKMDASPPPNPPEIVLTTVFTISLRREGLLSLDRLLLLRLSSRGLGVLLFRRGLLPLGLRSWCRPSWHRFATYLCKWPAWINSSILSLRAWLSCDMTMVVMVPKVLTLVRVLRRYTPLWFFDKVGAQSLL